MLQLWLISVFEEPLFFLEVVLGIAGNPKLVARKEADSCCGNNHIHTKVQVVCSALFVSHTMSCEFLNTLQKVVSRQSLRASSTSVDQTLKLHVVVGYAFRSLQYTWFLNFVGCDGTGDPPATSQKPNDRLAWYHIRAPHLR